MQTLTLNIRKSVTMNETTWRVVVESGSNKIYIMDALAKALKLANHLTRIW